MHFSIEHKNEIKKSEIAYGKIEIYATSFTAIERNGSSKTNILPVNDQSNSKPFRFSKPKSKRERALTKWQKKRKKENLCHTQIFNLTLSFHIIYHEYSRCRLQFRNICISHLARLLTLIYFNNFTVYRKENLHPNDIV